MGRIEDDREAARAAERLLQQQRAKEDRAKEQVQADSAFSRLIQKAKDENVRAHAKVEHTQREEERFVQEEEETLRDGEPFKESAEAHIPGRSRRMGRFEKERRERAVQGDHQARGRAADSREQSDKLTEKRDQSLAKPSGASGLSGQQRVERESEGAGGGGGGDRKDQSRDDGKPQEFRLNPALMAPVPVARPKEAGNPKLRALANEIAQKIVQRVYVGKNSEGAAEFQIDLKSSVLKGLSIKLSGSKGRIKAMFLSSDKEVLKLLREQSDALKAALTSRGLQLEELRLEERA